MSLNSAEQSSDNAAMTVSDPPVEAIPGNNIDKVGNTIVTPDPGEESVDPPALASTLIEIEDLNDSSGDSESSDEEIHDSAADGNIDDAMMGELIDLKYRDDNGRTHLMHAVENNDEATIIKILALPDIRSTFRYDQYRIREMLMYPWRYGLSKNCVDPIKDMLTTKYDYGIRDSPQCAISDDDYKYIIDTLTHSLPADNKDKNYDFRPNYINWRDNEVIFAAMFN
jgi:hypothetical protein